jgi:hypothetical protein
MTQLTKDFFIAAIVRAVRTFAQAALGMVTVGAAMTEIDWVAVISVSGVAAIISILTSIVTGLPEAHTDGKLLIDCSDPEKDIWRLQFDSDLDEIKNNKVVSFLVDKNANLPQK